MNTRKLTHIAITVACLALAGCASTRAATPTAPQPPQPTITEAATIAPTEALEPTATSAATSIPRPTQAPAQPTQVEPPTPVDTPVPTATAYPAPAIPLSSTGPWLIFRADNYLWAINQDGTGLTRLTNEFTRGFAVQPTSTIQGGLTIAYAVWIHRADRLESEIKLLSWPAGKVTTIVDNMSTWVDELNWSPSGSKLAFVGAMGDTYRNAFVYDSATDQSTRITAVDIDVHRLGWSPDERYVVFETYYRGMSGPETDGVWSARADASGVTQLVGRAENQYIGVVQFQGWLNPTEIIVTFEQRILGIGNIGNTDIRVINVETGNYTIPVSEPLLDVAYSPQHNLFLLAKEIAPTPNSVLIFYQNGERREVAGYAINRLSRLKAYGAFLGQTPDGRAYLISPDGIVTEIPTPEWKMENTHYVIASPDGQWWVWHSFGYSAPSELWVGPALGQPSALLAFSEPVPDYRVVLGDVRWSPDSQYLLWLNRKGLFIAKPPNFEATLATQLPGEWGDGAGQRGGGADFSDAVWVQ